MTERAPANRSLEVLRQVRLLPLVVITDPSAAAPLGQTLVHAGLPIMEIALRTPAALDAIRAASKTPHLCVGAGTVVRADQVAEVAEAGAQFVVTPAFDLDIVRVCAQRGLAVIPGTATATEIHNAVRAGLDTVKFFPAASLGGPAAIRAISAAYPAVRFVPTGGITADTCGAYLAEAAVLAVGGSWMVPGSALDRADFAEIAELCRGTLTGVSDHTASRA